MAIKLLHPTNPVKTGKTVTSVLFSLLLRCITTLNDNMGDQLADEYAKQGVLEASNIRQAALIYT